MTNAIEDIVQNTKLILLIGSNPEEAHPVIGMQIRQAVERGCKLILADPRKIGLSEHADIHLKLKPGTNVAFANGMAHIIIRDGLADMAYINERCEGFEEFKAMVADYTPERVAEICEIPQDDLISAAHMFAQAPAAAIMYCLGVTEHSTGTDGVFSLSNLSMLTGNLGKSGGGVNPLRGQNNVQGACDMGAGPDDMTGYQKVAKEGVLEKFEKAWGVTLNHNQGTKATEIFPKMISGEVKGVFIFGEDPIRTDPDTGHVIKALSNVEFLVVDDLFLTETAKYADVVLPGAAFAEKEGTFTNTERRVQRVRKAVESPGQAKQDHWIFSEIMRRMGYDQAEVNSAQIMDEIASLTPSYAGISHARLDSEALGGAGLQWPCTDEHHPGTRIMHQGSFARGLGMFKPVAYRPSAELPDADYPFILSTGRILYHYNAAAFTERSHGTMSIAQRSFIELNDHDALELGIKDGDKVRVSSRRGSITSWARVSPKNVSGRVWMPFHFQDGNSNWLTNAALDPVSKAPEFKVCAVKVEKAQSRRLCAFFSGQGYKASLALLY